MFDEKHWDVKNMDCNWDSA